MINATQMCYYFEQNNKLAKSEWASPTQIQPTSIGIGSEEEANCISINCTWHYNIHSNQDKVQWHSSQGYAVVLRNLSYAFAGDKLR